jgi:hypothetical protein
MTTWSSPLPFLPRIPASTVFGTDLCRPLLSFLHEILHGVFLILFISVFNWRSGFVMRMAGQVPPSLRKSSAPWDRLRPVKQDPLENMGYVSKGDSR